MLCARSARWISAGQSMTGANAGFDFFVEVMISLAPRGHIGLDAVKPARGGTDAALRHDGLEDLPRGKIHGSRIKNESFTIIQLSE